MTSAPAISHSPAGDLRLGHIFDAAGLTDLSDVLVIRHTYREDAIRTPADVNPQSVYDFTRGQSVSTNIFPKDPPRLWLVFMADGGLRARFYTAYVNHGEDLAARTDEYREYSIEESPVLSALAGRLVIEWSKDAVRWAKRGHPAAQFRVVEIADPEAVPFPGFDQVLIDHAKLLLVVDDARYAAWRTALGAVQGIYLITDKSTGKHYVGKADGSERILQRWTAYARDGHGGNKGLRQLSDADSEHARHFQFSLLRVFGPSVPMAEVNEAEEHYKKALLSRKFGLNHI